MSSAEQYAHVSHYPHPIKVHISVAKQSQEAQVGCNDNSEFFKDKLPTVGSSHLHSTPCLPTYGVHCIVLASTVALYTGEAPLLRIKRMTNTRRQETFLLFHFLSPPIAFDKIPFSFITC